MPLTKDGFPDSRAVIKKCRKCGGRLHGGECDNHYCPASGIKRTPSPPEPDKVCSHCKAYVCICDAREALMTQDEWSGRARND